jgi:hypothetical protein
METNWYDKSYVCCYNNTDVFTEEENNLLTERDKLFVRDVLYRQDLLNIFYLETFDDALILSSVSRIFELVKNNIIIQTLIKSIVFLNEDELVRFMTLFSFERLHETHSIIKKCLS